MAMLNPCHPGEILRDNLEAAELSVTEAASRLGCTRQALSRLLNGKAGASPTMALARPSATVTLKQRERYREAARRVFGALLERHPHERVAGNYVFILARGRRHVVLRPQSSIVGDGHGGGHLHPGHDVAQAVAAHGRAR